MLGRSDLDFGKQTVALTAIIKGEKPKFSVWQLEGKKTQIMMGKIAPKNQFVRARPQKALVTNDD